MKTTFLSLSDCIVVFYYPHGTEIFVFKSKPHIEAYSQNCKISVTGDQEQLQKESYHCTHRNNTTMVTLNEKGLNTQ